MNRRFHKRALSATTAILTLTTAVTTVNAAQRNEITIESDSESVTSGDTFNVTVGYVPDSTGASGFTIDLHYDPEAVNLNIPSDGGYDVVNGFAIVTNFQADDGVIRIVGANLSGGNVTDTTQIGDFSFTVKDGYHGDIDFWTDVVTLVAADGDDFVNVEFRTKGPYQPYTVSGPAEESSSVEETSTATQSTTVTTVTEPKATETTTVTTTVETQPLPEEIIPETTTTTTTTTAVQTELPAETEASEEAEDTDETFGEALFSYTQGDSDYNNEEALQYSFSPYDYVDSADEPVDISVSVSSTSAVQGGIGMLTSDGWTIYSTGSQGGEQVWTANNVDLSEVSGDIAVQLYYLKHNSTFEISSISITPSSEEAADEVTDEIAEEESSQDSQDSQTETQPAETTAVTTEAPKETSTVTEESVAETTAVTTEEIPEETTVSSVEDATQTEAVKQTVMAETTSADEEIPETDDSEAAETADTASTDSESSETAKTESNTESAAETTAQDVQQVVAEASGKADSNPDTGNGLGKYVCAGVMILCGAQMAYSIYALTRKNEN